jgi:hypothetical protein
LKPRSASAQTAYLAAAVNLLAALILLLVLRHGLPGSGAPVDERLAYIESHAGLWTLGWVIWNAAAVTLVAFFVVLAIRFWATAPLICGLALVCAAAGLAADLSAEALYLSAAAGVSARVYAEIEPLASLLTGYVGNGLYTLAGILLLWAGWPKMPVFLAVLALPLWLAGIALSISSLVGSTAGQTLSTAVLMPLFIIWAALMGRWLQSPRS